MYGVANNYYTAAETSFREGSQVRKVFNHLACHGSITQLEAHEIYRVHRLASRINDLKRAGIRVRSEMRHDAAGQRYVRYFIQW